MSAILVILPTILELIIIILIFCSHTLGEFLVQAQFYLLIPFITLTIMGIIYLYSDSEFSLAEKIYLIIFGIVGVIIQGIIFSIFCAMSGLSYGGEDIIFPAIYVSIVISIVLAIALIIITRRKRKEK